MNGACQFLHQVDDPVPFFTQGADLIFQESDLFILAADDLSVKLAVIFDDLLPMVLLTGTGGGGDGI